MIPRIAPRSSGSLLRLAVLALALSSWGCAHRRAARGQSPDQVLTRARSRTSELPLSGRFGIRMDAPGLFGITRGSMVLHPPDRFRFEIRTPFGTPMLYVAGNGTAVHAWMQAEQRFYRGDDAQGVVDELTGGAVTVTDLLALLTGTLPLAQAEVLSLEKTPRGARVVLKGPDSIEVDAEIDARWGLCHTLLVRDVSTDPATVLFEIRYEDTLRAGRTRYPEEVHVTLPRQDARVHLEINAWDPLGRVPEVFDLVAPPGSLELDLVESLRSATGTQVSSATEAESPPEVEVPPEAPSEGATPESDEERESTDTPGVAVEPADSGASEAQNSP